MYQTVTLLSIRCTQWGYCASVPTFTTSHITAGLWTFVTSELTRDVRPELGKARRAGVHRITLKFKCRRVKREKVVQCMAGAAKVNNL
jgi:hypothetical protein